MSRVLFLARGEPTQYGYSWPGRGVDGPHDTPEGVAEAAKLIGRILGDDGPWVMVEVHSLPGYRHADQRGRPGWEPSVAPPPSRKSLRDCPDCGGSGEIHWNPSRIRDPQCEESATCGRCHGFGAINELPASCAPERGHSEGVLSPRLASAGNRTDPSGGFLERCPACGRENDRDAFEGWEGWPDVDGSSKFVVRCPKCEALHPDQTQHEDAR